MSPQRDHVARPGVPSARHPRSRWRIELSADGHPPVFTVAVMLSRVWHSEYRGRDVRVAALRRSGSRSATHRPWDDCRRWRRV